MVKDAFHDKNDEIQHQITRPDLIVRKINREYSLKLDPDLLPDFHAPAVVKAFYKLFDKTHNLRDVGHERNLRPFIEMGNQEADFLLGQSDPELYSAGGWEHMMGEELDTEETLRSFQEGKITQLTAGNNIIHTGSHKFVPTIIGSSPGYTVKASSIEGLSHGAKAAQTLLDRGIAVNIFSLIRSRELDLGLMISPVVDAVRPRSFAPYTDQIRALIQAQIEAWRDNPNLTSSPKKMSNAVVDIFENGNIVEAAGNLMVVGAELRPVSGKTVGNNAVSGDIATQIYDQLRHIKIMPHAIGMEYSKGEKKLTYA